MKILFICEGITPEVRGGSQAVVEGLSQALAQRGHSIIILAASTAYGLPVEEIRQKNLRIRRFFLPGKNRLGDALALPFSLRKTLSGFLFETQIFNAIVLEHVLSGLYATFHFPKAELLYQFHSPWYLEYQIRKRQEKGRLSRMDSAVSGLMKFIQACLIKRTQVVTLSEYMKKEASKIHPRPTISVVPGGVNIEQFYPSSNRGNLREKLGMRPDQFILFTARRMTARTGIDLLLKAVQNIHTRFPNLRLFIAGTGPLEGPLKEQAQEAKMNSTVRFVGRLENSQLVEYYQAADLFVMPSLELEGFGMATLEALACGTPVLGTRVGGTPEILEPLNPDFLVEKPEAGLFAQALSNWISRKNELAEWRPKVRIYVERNYAWDKIAVQFEGLLNGVKG